MGYKGQVELKSTEVKRQTITGSTSATHTLNWTPPNEQSLLITINGVGQHDSAYTVSGTTLTLASALVSSDELEITGIQDAGKTITPAAGSVIDAHLSPSASISQSKLNLAITGSEVASTFDISSKTVTLPAASVTAHVTQTDTSVIENNLAMLAFKVAAADSLSKFQMVDSVIDDFKDLTGCDAGNSTNEYLNDTTAGAEFVYGGTSAGFVVRTPTADTTSSAGAQAAALAGQLHDGNWDNIWDIDDGLSWSGIWMKDDLGSAYVVRRCRYKISSGTGTYEVYGSNDGSNWTSMGTCSSGDFTATNGLVFEFPSNNTAYRYWRATVRSQTANTSSGDPKELEWSTSDVSIGDLTFVSTSTTAEATAKSADLVVLIEDAGGNVGTLGTDIKGYVSRNGNANYSGAVTWVDEGDWGTNKRIITARGIDLSSLAGTTDMRYKITTHNQSATKETRIHAVSLAWS